MAISAEAERALAASPRAEFQDIDFSFYYPKAWFEAVIARDSGDSAGDRCRLSFHPRDFGAAFNH